MFKQAKLKLTAWYLLILLSILLIFSCLVYFGTVRSTEQTLDLQKRRAERQLRSLAEYARFQASFSEYEKETMHEVRSKTFFIIIIVNTTILILSGGLAYLLAGKTLTPIEEMLSKQKRFISDAAHEIKTPLTAMKTDLEVTLRAKNLNIDAAKQTMIDAIEEIDKLHLLTNRLLQESKYQSKNGTNDFEIINLENIINKVTKKLTNHAKQKEQEFKLNIVKVKVKGDEYQLEELFTNIIENAIKYNKSQANIEINLYEHKGHAITQVKDYGIGINKNDLPNVFEPFYRADLSRKDSKKEGFGLGLSIAKEIVERHKGQISVESKQDHYTIITIKLPKFSEYSQNSVIG